MKTVCSPLAFGNQLLQSADEVPQQENLTEKLSRLTTPVSELEEGLLVSATYDGEKRVAVLKFYDPRLDRVWLWEDNTGHKPYCYSKLPREEVLSKLSGRSDITSVEEVEKLDLLSDSRIMARRIVATDPLAIGGQQGRSIRDIMDVWEGDIKYYENYVYDKRLRVGTYYRVSNGTIAPLEKTMPETVAKSLDQILSKNTGEQVKFINAWADLLGQPLCSFKRIATDIEVANEEGRIPDPEKADRAVIAVSFYNESESLVYLVAKDGDVSLDGARPSYRAVVFPDEAAMIRGAFSKMMDYPFLLTFNGDDFDLRYLKHRAERLGVKEDEIPINLQRQEASLKHGVHIDLYRFFNNRSIQIYVYGNKYAEHTLNGISEAVLGKSKIEFEGNVGDLPLLELANYCLNDSQLTFELTNVQSSLLMKILLVISRIAKMPMNDVARLGVSNWIRSMLFYEHRSIDAIIPRQDELKLKGGASSEAIIKGKKYKGGLVIEPKPGVHFGVSVLDFASLYPSIIKVYNLSYETVNCPHEECRTNKVPDTDHWVCKRRSGITSLVIGSLRDLRVGHYKHLAKDKTLSQEERDLSGVVSQGLKVILNASYGVFGFETFALYCLPVAEATAALGRYAITKTIEKCNSEGISVIYSDTDSLFIENPNRDKITKVSEWAEKELGVELDIDKSYRYVAFSDRKKNYFGVLADGTADIKGLTGKKSQTPEFLKRTFYQSLDILGRVYAPEDFEHARSEIKTLLTTMVSKMRNKEVSLDDLAFNVMIGKAISGYSGTNPQHVKAADLLQKSGREIKAGDIISFVKTKTPLGVKPVSLARVDEVDVDKYLEYASSMFDQMLDSLGFSFDEFMGSTTLDAFWS
jgi:DNA polymerase, archaea type